MFATERFGSHIEQRMIVTYAWHKRPVDTTGIGHVNFMDPGACLVQKIFGIQVTKSGSRGRSRRDRR